MVDALIAVVVRYGQPYVCGTRSRAEVNVSKSSANVPMVTRTYRRRQLDRELASYVSYMTATDIGVRSRDIDPDASHPTRARAYVGHGGGRARRRARGISTTPSRVYGSIVIWIWIRRSGCMYVYTSHIQLVQLPVSRSRSIRWPVSHSTPDTIELAIAAISIPHHAY